MQQPLLKTLQNTANARNQMMDTRGPGDWFEVCIERFFIPLKLQETQLGKTASLFECSEFGAVLTVSCVFCSFSGIKVLEQRSPNQSPGPRTFPLTGFMRLLCLTEGKLLHRISYMLYNISGFTIYGRTTRRFQDSGNLAAYHR